MVNIPIQQCTSCLLPYLGSLDKVGRTSRKTQSATWVSLRRGVRLCSRKKQRKHFPSQATLDEHNIVEALCQTVIACDETPCRDGTAPDPFGDKMTLTPQTFGSPFSTVAAFEMAWKGYHIANVGDASEVAEKSVEAESEAAVRWAPPSPQVQIPREVVASGLAGMRHR